jgi:uncharacterized protein
MIERKIYLNRIMPFVGKKLIKVFTGQRRVGKSHLLRTIAKKLESTISGIQIMMIDKEKFEFDNIVNYVDLMQYIEQNRKAEKIGLFIDEVQDIESFEKALRSLYSEDAFDIYISGSNANLLSGELGTLLSGRYIEIEVLPFTYNEFLEINQTTNSEANFNKYLQFGALPGLNELPDVDYLKEEYLKNIYNSIMFRDVIKRNQIRNVVFLENLIHFVADNIGSLVSSNKISEYLKSQKTNISTNSVIEYLELLCNAFIIRKVKRLDIKGKRVFEIGEKYFFEDLGIRHAIVGYRSTDIQKFLENIVFNHLKAMQYKVSVGIFDNKEIDFVAEKNGERKYIQVAYLLTDQNTIEREFGNLLNIKDNYPKYVVSMDKHLGKNTIDGIFHLSVQDFLMNIE